MADTIRQTESPPDRNPIEVTGQGPSSRLIWERIDAYIAHRWTPRSVVWIVEGAGDWTPPLTPVVTATGEKWESNAWVSVTLTEGPYGYDLLSDGPYRITATVGGGDLPAVVDEAYDRLFRYVYAVQRTPGERLAYRKVTMNSYENRPIQYTPSQEAVRQQEVDGAVEYAANWPAKAMQLSGAADLLRPYRRA